MRCTLATLLFAGFFAACSRSPKTESNLGERNSFKSNSAGSAAAASSKTVPMGSNKHDAPPLVLALSPTRSWVAWEIALKKRWLDEDAVKVRWLPYVASLEAFGSGAADAVALTNADALNIASTGTPGVAILALAHGNTSDALLAKSGINSVVDLKGKRVGAELGFTGHLLLMSALRRHGLKESDIQLANVPADVAELELLKGSIDAVMSRSANTSSVNQTGVRAIFTSKDLPGVTFDALTVNPKSLSKRTQDWNKVVQVWFRINDYLQSPENVDEAAAIIGARMGVDQEAAKRLLQGTLFLGQRGNRAAFATGSTHTSIRHSSRLADRFHVANEVYAQPLSVEQYFNSSWANNLVSK